MKRFYIKVIYGHSNGIIPFFMNCFLSIFSVFYRLTGEIYKILVKLKLLPQKKLPVPVISIGNITTGGTGKTPCVEHVAKVLSSKGLKVAIFSKGYGKHPYMLKDDEELSFEHENVKRYTHSKKYKLFDIISRSFSPNVIVLDDGFQHFRLYRDLDIVLIDAINPFSNGKILPAGFLRESLSSLKRADLVIITRTDQTSKGKIEKIRNIILEHNPVVPLLEATHSVDAVKDIKTGKLYDHGMLYNFNFLGFCGIGNPVAFRKTLHMLNIKVEKFIAYPDHYYYTKNDQQLLNLLSREFMCSAFITTSKDEHRIDKNSLDFPIFSLITSFKITSCDHILERAMDRIMQEYPLVKLENKLQSH